VADSPLAVEDAKFAVVSTVSDSSLCRECSDGRKLVTPLRVHLLDSASEVMRMRRLWSNEKENVRGVYLCNPRCIFHSATELVNPFASVLLPGATWVMLIDQ
jgi:hypothetical protein